MRLPLQDHFDLRKSRELRRTYRHRGEENLYLRQ